MKNNNFKKFIIYFLMSGFLIKLIGSVFKGYFIPHEKNNYKPRILHKKSLVIITISLCFIKILLSGYLFLIYPNEAKMSELMSVQILEMVNKERGEYNIHYLSRNSILDIVALEKAEDMFNNNYFAHKSTDGKMIWDLIDENEYSYLYVGENLAMNFTEAESAHNALMQSETHKINILNEQYNEIGIAVIGGIMDGKKTNVLVQLFASSSDVPIKNYSVSDRNNINTTTEALIDSKVKIVSAQLVNQTGFNSKIIKISYYVFSFILILIILSLIVNILIKFSVQHKSVIIQSMFVIIFVISLMYIKLHHLEYVIDKIFII